MSDLEGRAEIVNKLRAKAGLNVPLGPLVEIIEAKCNHQRTLIVFLGLFSNSFAMARKKKSQQIDVAASTNGNGITSPVNASPTPSSIKTKTPEPSTSALIICRNK